MLRKQFIFSLAAAIISLTRGSKPNRTRSHVSSTKKKPHPLSDDEMREGVALINVDKEITTVSVYKNSFLLHEQVIPFGTKGIYDSVGLAINKSPRETLAFIQSVKIEFRNKISCYDSNCGTRLERIKRISRLLAYRRVAYPVQKCFEGIFESSWHVIKNSENSENFSSGIVITGDLTDFPEVITVAQLNTYQKCRLG